MDSAQPASLLEMSRTARGWALTQTRVASDVRTGKHVQAINKSPLDRGVHEKVRKEEDKTT